MTARRPVVLVSGIQSELPTGDTIDGALYQGQQIVAGSGLVGGGLFNTDPRVDVALADNPSGLYFTGDGKVGYDGRSNVSLASNPSGLYLDSDNLGFDGQSSSVQFVASGSGVVARTVESKLQDSISTEDFGIPGDLTDPDGDNHTKLQQAALAAVNADVPLIIIGQVLVSDTVNFDTSSAPYGGGGGKALVVKGGATGAGLTGCGIYGNAESFTGTSKNVVLYKGQNRSSISNLAFKLYQPSTTYTYATLRDVINLWVQSTDRCIIEKCSIGGLVRPGAIDIGAGEALRFDDCMSCCVRECDIQYVTKKGISYSATGGSTRTGTSFKINGCHFSVGYSVATSRDECEGLDLSGTQAWFINQCVFDNNNKGRAVLMDGEHNVLRDCWFEGNYDTILLEGGIGNVIKDNYGIGYNPALSYIEGYLNYTPPSGVLAIGTPDATALDNANIEYFNFYQAANQQNGNKTFKDDLTITGQISVDTLKTYKSGSGINVVAGVGTNHSTVTNNQTHLIVDHYAGNTAGIKLANAGTVKARAYTDLTDVNTGLVVYLEDTRRITVANTSGDQYYIAPTYFQPGDNNTKTLGADFYRWSEVFAVNGTINTSDAREKQQVRSISDAERAVAIKAKSLLKAYKWNHAVEAKGDADARWHFGIIAQELAEAFESEGLDAGDYGMFTYAEQKEEKDSDGNIVQEACNTYGVRYTELLAFIIAAL